MKAKKFIEKKIEGEYEIIKNHVVEVEEDIDPVGIADRFNLLDEDGDTAYFSYGLCFDMDGELFCIGVDKFIKGITELLDDNDDYWNIEKEQHELFEKQLKLLKKYKGYDIYL
jgi:hypothetical protein